MAEPILVAAAWASGAVAFLIDRERVQFEGNIQSLGLLKSDYALAALAEKLAPAERADFAHAIAAGAIDLRVRLVGDKGAVRYLRFIGRREGDGPLTGLVLPAGLFSLDARDQLNRENRVAAAVEDGEILAHYQPIVSLETGELAGFEALARWDRPGVGLIGPDDFIPLADDLDLLGKIGAQVRRTAANDLSAWKAAAPEAPLFIAANATVSELLSDGFAAALIDAVGQADLRAGSYKLEIAETEIMKQPEAAEKVMAELKAAGITLALDDFGTGYSSLSRLDEFSFDTVKIDRYFVRAMASSPSATKVVESVLQLARHFGMTVVAEGIEDEETARLLADMGCDYGQGFRFAGALAPQLASEIVKSGLTGRIRPPAGQA
ncbi:EAL domain-containing protein [Hyphobacterium sp. HN65]|uniref:EAL domain-containing protein n=1 Tax=Hyphobacterium lacteum TaxID=3116575 RepID=A0ABU7LN26_9PROT|nr:EAL domain-containing protein [Hyphobacterium sp. HN65]MEE2525302.1 EAL domain-containing protein [Hyphobacterium sp. HN65]